MLRITAAVLVNYFKISLVLTARLFFPINKVTGRSSSQPNNSLHETTVCDTGVLQLLKDTNPKLSVTKILLFHVPGVINYY